MSRVGDPGARPAAARFVGAVVSQPASAAKLTRGIVAGTVYFNNVEALDIARSGTAGIAAICRPIGGWTRRRGLRRPRRHRDRPHPVAAGGGRASGPVAPIAPVTR
jgi:hypothetical protein